MYIGFVIVGVTYALVGRYALHRYKYFIVFTLKLSYSSDHGLWDCSGYEPLVTRLEPAIINLLSINLLTSFENILRTTVN